MADVWFIRHGESEYNAGYVVPDEDSTALTEKGRQQARDLSIVFPKAPDLVVVSKYLRTKQTAEPCLERFPFVKCEEWDVHEFNNIPAASCINTNHEQRSPVIEAYWQKRDSDYISGDGTESFSMMVLRIKSAYEKLQKAEENFIAVFTHGIMMRTMLIMFLHPEMSNQQLIETFIDTEGQFGFDNCGIMTAKADKKGVLITALPDNYLNKAV